MEKHEITKYDIENDIPYKKKKKLHKTHIQKPSKKNNHHNHKCHSNKNANILKNHHFYKLEKISIQRESSNNNLKTINKKYKKDLFLKIAEFLDKKKFKIANNFDAKNSKKFLDKKNKCLERIILSDTIENNKNQEICIDSKNKKSKKKYQTQKNIHKYFIVITNYDEEKSRNSQIIDNNISTVNKLY